MSSHEPRRPAEPHEKLTDPRAMRAMAHPLRIALIELLSHTGTLTATQASEALGESPANCAFHLRTLAKYGFVEEAGGGRGRERPWRRAQSGVSIPEGSAKHEGGADATALFDFLTQTLLDKARTSLGARQSWPIEWQDALDQGEFVNYMTLDEARELMGELQQLLMRYVYRVNHPELRPEGAMPIEMLSIAYPLLHLSEVQTHPQPSQTTPSTEE
ncbi:MAG TPA: helix-turn-helix domain-containing protein [Streptosporangiaceae bacterium]|jgi:predicted ArsR family transcriptional regulator